MSRRVDDPQRQRFRTSTHALWPSLLTCHRYVASKIQPSHHRPQIAVIWNMCAYAPFQNPETDLLITSTWISKSLEVACVSSVRRTKQLLTSWGAVPGGHGVANRVPSRGLTPAMRFVSSLPAISPSFQTMGLSQWVSLLSLHCACIKQIEAKQISKDSWRLFDCRCESRRHCILPKGNVMHMASPFWSQQTLPIRHQNLNKYSEAWHMLSSFIYRHFDTRAEATCISSYIHILTLEINEYCFWISTTEYH